MDNEKMKVHIFSALEVANICGVVNQTTINWIKNGYLKAFVTPGGQYRVYADDLIEFLKERGMRIPQKLLDLQKEKVEWNSIIIVDDDKSFNDLLKKRLAKMSQFRIIQAFDGFEAGRSLSENKPGVIILDINLPGVDGHALCKKIKSDPILGNSVIIAISGLEDPELEKEVLADGADAYLAKPFNNDTLISEIKKYLKQHQSQGE
jgi:two-component system OmpR family response regulator